MDIKVLNEDRARVYPRLLDGVGTHANISIRSPGMISISLPLHAQRQDELFLKFHDVDDRHKEQLMPSNLVYFDNEMAKQIKAFLEKNILVDTLIVNCEAGISRSAGVAAAISKHLTGDDSFFFKNYLPNRLVYRLLLEEFHTEPSDVSKYNFVDNGKGLLTRPIFI
jgi:hypothetical protein